MIGLPELVVARHDKVAKAAKRAKRSGVVVGLPRACASAASGCATPSSSAATSTAGRTVALRARAHGAAGRARRHAGRRGGVASNWPTLATGDAHLPAATIFVMGGVAERHRREVSRLLKRLPGELRRDRRAAPGASCSSSWSAGGPRPRRPGRRSAPRCAPCPGRQPETEPVEPAQHRHPVAEPRGDAPRRRAGAHRPAAAAPVRPGGMSPRRRP